MFAITQEWVFSRVSKAKKNCRLGALIYSPKFLFMYKTLRFLLPLVTTVLPILLHAQPGAGGAGAGAAGGAAGGGGSNVYGFRYILLSDKKAPPKINRFVPSSPLQSAYLVPGSTPLLQDSATHKEPEYYYSGNYYRVLYRFQQAARTFMLGLFKVDRADSIASHYDSTQRVITRTQYTIRPNGDTNWVYTNGTRDTIYVTKHRILYDYIVPTHRLAIFLLGRDQDTVMFEVWPPNKRLQNANYDSAYTVVEGIQNKDLYNHYRVDRRGNVTYNRQADTFYFVPHWRNHGVGPRFQTFNLLFSTKYFIPVSIPLVYNFKAKSYLANFLNAGMAYGWGLGRTKFYRDAIQTSRNFYIGGGFLGGISTATISAQTVNDSALKVQFAGGASSTLPEVYYGFHMGISFSSVQFIVSGTWQTAIGDHAAQWSYQNHFSLGIGIGLSLFNLVVPNSASAPIGH
jgi:hypothetical protein